MSHRPRSTPFRPAGRRPDRGPRVVWNALPPSLRRVGRSARRQTTVALGATLRALLALPVESAREAERAVARVMQYVRAHEPR